MGVNVGFPPGRPEPNLEYDSNIDGRESVACGRCGRTVPVGAHIVVHPCGPNMHVMFCPGCCPCRRGVEA